MQLTIEQALQKGIEAHKAAKLQEAEAFYRAILKVQPNHPAANHNLGLLAVSVNKTYIAVPLFKKSVEGNPKVAQYWLSFISALIEENQINDAMTMIEKGGQACLSEDAIKVLKISLSQKILEQDTEKIDKKIIKTTSKNNKKIKKNKQDIDSLRNKIKFIYENVPSSKDVKILFEYYQSKQYDLAKKLALENIKKFPKHEFSWKVLGASLKQLGRLDESLSANKVLIEISPNDSGAYNNLGVTLQELGRLDEAEKSYKKAISIKPMYAEAYYNLANTLKDLNRLNEAKINYEQSILINTNYAESYNNLGVVLEELARLDEAEKNFKKAISIRPLYAEAYYNLGNILKKTGQLEEACKIYKQAIVINLDYAECYSNLGVILQELGFTEDAEDNFKKAITIKSDFAAAHLNLIILLKKQKRYSEAKKCCEFALSINSDFFDIQYELATLGAGQTPVIMPGKYVASLFDSYASKFDNHLVNILDYRAPTFMHEQYKRYCANKANNSIDLGCGTGLTAEIFRNSVNHMIGVDLSQVMLSKAKIKNLYDELICDDICNYLEKNNNKFDLITCMDVLIYIGDLSNLFINVKKSLEVNGFFGFSIESSQFSTYELKSSGRYGHGLLYIKKMAKINNLSILEIKDINIRKENGNYIKGAVILMKN